MKKVSLLLSAAVMAVVMMTSCGGSRKEITIGTQVWMAANLDVDKFQNGDPILHAETDEEWRKAGEEGKPAWCYYDNDPKNGGKYGKLYNWYAIIDPRGLAPEGWRIPKEYDWEQLMLFLDPDIVDHATPIQYLLYHGSFEAAQKIKAKKGWGKENESTNITGFSALPGGNRDFNGVFRDINVGAYFWISSSEDVKSMIISNNYPILVRTVMIESNKEKEMNGYSVRCVK